MNQDLIVKDTGMIAKVELDTQISTAKAYPRDAKKAVEYAIYLATLDEETAISCFYVLPRKEKDGTKKEIKGGSIRLAEIMANAWGNLHAATRIVENDGRHITAEGVAWDLETNVKVTMQNKVSIRFGEKEGKGGYTANTDMQTVLSNAASAKALRNAIFKVIPKALADRVREQAMLFAVGDQKSINVKVAEIFDKLTKMGIDKQKILDYYGRKSLAEITTEDFRSLIGVGTAIKEGHIKIEEVFETETSGEDTSQSAAQRINTLISDKKSRNKEMVNEQTGEVSMPQSSNAPSFDEVKKQMETAKTLDDLNIAKDVAHSIETTKEQFDELAKIYKEKQKTVRS